MRKYACKKCSFLLRMGLLIALMGLGQNLLVRAESHGSLRGQLESQLGTRISAIWRGQGLGVVLDRLADSQGIVFWVDRRVDLQQPVEVHFRDLPLREILKTLTEDQSLGWANLGNICYVGPQDAAREIASLLELAKDSVQELPNRQRDKWMRVSGTSWPRLSEPRLLLSEWLEAQGIELVHPELISHDLWAAKKLPPMPFVEQVVLLLVGFDLTCQISPNGDKCIVVSIKKPVRITRSYEAGRKSHSVIEQMSRVAPELSVVRQGRGLSATGRWEDHEKLAKSLSGGNPDTPYGEPPTPVQRRQMFSLQLKNQPLGKVITQLAQQLGLEVVWEKNLLDRKPDPREQLVSCDVQEADLSVLLHAIVDPMGIDFRLKDDELTLFVPREQLGTEFPRKHLSSQ